MREAGKLLQQCGAVLVVLLLLLGACSKKDDGNGGGPCCPPVSTSQRTEIEAGKADLEVKNIQAAFLHFEAAYNESPHPNEVKFWYAATRLAKWCEDNMIADGPGAAFMDSAKEVLDAFAYSNNPGERNILNFTATLPEDINGDYIVPSTLPDADEVLEEYLRDVFLAELQRCIDVVDSICTNCTNFHYQSTEYTNGDDYEIDVADIYFLRSGLYGVKAWLHFLMGYDDGSLDVYNTHQLDSSGALDLNTDVLNPHPNLLKVDEAAQFVHFEACIKEAIRLYKAGALAMRAEGDDQIDDLITIGDPAIHTPQEIEEQRYREEDVRDIIENQFEYSMYNGAVTLHDIETHDPTDTPGTMVGWIEETLDIDLQPLFSGVDLRALLPVYNSVCKNIVDPVPDATMGGLTPSRTAQQASWDFGLLILGAAVPTATPTIDGNAGDWSSIAVFYTDKANDADEDDLNGLTLSGVDINVIKIARDATNLYGYISFNGPAISNDGNTTYDKTWDMDIKPFEHDSTDPEFNISIRCQNTITPTLYGPGISGTAYVARGTNFIEFYVPLANIGNPGAGTKKVFSFSSSVDGSNGTAWGWSDDDSNNAKTGDF